MGMHTIRPAALCIGHCGIAKACRHWRGNIPVVSEAASDICAHPRAAVLRVLSVLVYPPVPHPLTPVPPLP